MALRHFQQQPQNLLQLLPPRHHCYYLEATHHVLFLCLHLQFWAVADFDHVKSCASQSQRQSVSGFISAFS